jgi:endoglucanase
MSPARGPTTLLLILLALFGVGAQGRAVSLTGLNLAGAEFGSERGEPGRDYMYPSDDDLARVVGSGFDVVRLPFMWERLQHDLGGALDNEELKLLDATVARARAHKLVIVLDVHNYGRYRGELIGVGQVKKTHFADFWRKLAAHFANREGVIFGLMNEPHGFAKNDWVDAANAAIAAIRGAGAHNLVLAPGNAWTGAHSWNSTYYGVANGVAMKALVDPCNNTVIEFHQYFDDDYSGQKGNCQAPEVAAKTLGEATQWLRSQGRKGFLAEFGSGPGAACLATLEMALHHLDANADVWLGWTYWAAGAWLAKDYPLSVQPIADGANRPQMTVLLQHLAKPKPIAASCRKP